MSSNIQQFLFLTHHKYNFLINPHLMELDYHFNVEKICHQDFGDHVTFFFSKVSFFSIIIFFYILSIISKFLSLLKFLRSCILFFLFFQFYFNLRFCWLNLEIFFYLFNVLISAKLSKILLKPSSICLIFLNLAELLFPFYEFI